MLKIKKKEWVMNIKQVEFINDIDSIYRTIIKRIIDTGSLLESDELFLKFYKKYTDKLFEPITLKKDIK